MTVTRQHCFRRLLLSPRPRRPAPPVPRVQFAASGCSAAKCSQWQTSSENRPALLLCPPISDEYPITAGGIQFAGRSERGRFKNLAPLAQDEKNSGVSSTESCRDQAEAEPSSEKLLPFLAPSFFPILFPTIPHLLFLGGFP